MNSLHMEESPKKRTRGRSKKHSKPQFSTLAEADAHKSKLCSEANARRKTRSGPRKSEAERELENALKGKMN